MPIITGVELMFCMCGPLERKCSYCGGIFQESHHGGMGGVQGILLILPNLPPMNCDWIKCIFCGNLTWPKDYIKRSKEEIKAERRNQSNG